MKNKSFMLKYEIKGNDIQIAEVDLAPGQTVMAEAGTMLYMEAGITFEVKSHENEEAPFFEKVIAAGSRLLTGESLFFTHFKNEGTTRAKVAFTTSYPGTLVPLDLPQLTNNSVILQRDSFVCAAPNTKVSVYLNPNLRAGLLGGEGFILQKVTGQDTAIVHAAGSVIEKTLYNETLRVEPGSVVAFEESIKFDVESTGGLSSMVFGGEGLFLATLNGEGKVWLQSMPVRKLLYRLSAQSR
ncbi:MAG: TIGR00266 family protein [Bacteroidota bacterium]